VPDPKFVARAFTEIKSLRWISNVEAKDVLSDLCKDEQIHWATAIIAAHPDDETIFCGGRLPTFGNLTLVHITNGAPENLDDARHAGFQSREAYMRARWYELDRALRVLRVQPRRLQFDVSDQKAAFRLDVLTECLTEVLRDVRIVITHAYEGGHPDHDAAAFAVQAACNVLRGKANAPLRLEMTGYHERSGGRVSGVFWPDPTCQEVVVQVEGGKLAHKLEALACFRSQGDIVAWVDPSREVYRAAPHYDFTRLPPPGRALYDAWGWQITSEIWRAEARRVLLQSGRDACS
jgi:N-acetylglucosamine malate deacetylase 2